MREKITELCHIADLSDLCCMAERLCYHRAIFGLDISAEYVTEPSIAVPTFLTY